jgi:glycosyltransferase involved in cell wall biosynthesis
MRVLWIVNTIFPALSEALGQRKPVIGGWMYGLAEQLSKEQEIELAVATTYSGSELYKKTIDGIHYFLLPTKNPIKYDVLLERYWKQICDQFEPNIIHIHGTEFPHGLACMRKLPELKYVISIQGMTGIYARYYYSAISFFDKLINITFRDVIRFDSIFQQKKKFEQRGEYEKEYILRSKYVIGRTSWDKAHTKSINANLNYEFCNESLRNGFYDAKKWSIDECNKYTIFLSQAGYPIKGLHNVIKSVSLLKNEFPNIKIRVGGINITASKTLKEKIKISGYGNYIKKMINKNSLNDSIVFLGSLSEQEMIKEYQKANVFICPSSIENSPNSVGEAQLIGTPVIASYVGGVPDMVIHNETGLLYRFEEVEMLAENIRTIFKYSSISFNLSKNAITIANLRHNRQVNLKKTVDIYSKILNS